MELTGKCLADFKKFMLENYMDYCIEREAGDWNHGGSVYLSVYDIFEEIPIMLQQTLILEFLDSEKLFINIKSKNSFRKKRERFMYSFLSFKSAFLWDNRKEAIAEAIIIANNFYNNRR